jgi:hypothetical protein
MITETTLAKFGVPIVFKALGEIAKRSSKNFKSRLQTQHNQLIAENLCSEIATIAAVKTIWSFQSPTSLYSFYYPTRVRRKGFGLVTVRRIADLGKENCVVEGTVGMGKSMFLKYLACQELRPEDSTGRIPIHVELRRLRHGQKLVALILDGLKKYGFDVDENILGLYLSSGQIVLLLDGFDELAEGLMLHTIEEIETLIRIYRKKLQIIISSRPDSGIQASPSFLVFQLVELSSDDHAPFMKKLGLGAPEAETLNRELEQAPSSVLGLLKSPLLLTLLIMVFQANRTIPDTLPRFYDELFDILFIRHDGAKLGYKRPRKTLLPDSRIKKIFELVSFLCRAGGYNELPKHEFLSIVEKAASREGTYIDPDSFLDEMIQTASLLVKDGQNVAYIHKSVAEFYAAAFVRRAIDSVAEKFYKQLRTAKWNYWRVELAFLSEIDSYRYARYFLLPCIHNVLRDFANCETNQVACYEDFLSNNARYVLIHWPKLQSEPNFFQSSVTQFDREFALDFILKYWASHLLKSIACRCSDNCASGLLQKLSVQETVVRKELQGAGVSAWMLLQSDDFKSEVLDALKLAITDLEKDAERANRLVHQEEQKGQLIDFLT